MNDINGEAIYEVIPKTTINILVQIFILKDNYIMSFRDRVEK